MSNKNIPVLYTPDEKFMMQTCVAILSMELNKDNNTHYHYYFLVSDNIDRACFKYIHYLKNIIKDLKYSIMYFDTTDIDDKKIFTPHITSSTYYRLYAADYFSFDKCIYNDGDILVLDDLKSMYDIDIEDKYVAGVKSIVQQQGTEKDVERVVNWGFPTMDQYVVAGNLVFNIKKIKEDSLVRRFDEEISKSYPQQDQDVLNYCCYGKIGFLKLRYGIFNRWLSNNDIYKFDNQIFEQREVEEAIEKPAIIHFAGGIVKPWTNVRTSYATVWWEYAKRLLPTDEYIYWNERAKEISAKRDWNNILFAIKKMKRKIYIFGCTWIGQLLLEWLENGGVRVNGFVDNSQVVQGVEVKGKTVYALPDVQLTDDIAFVISSQKAYPEIYDQLVEYGTSTEKIYIYRHSKDDLYFQSLSPEFYEFEYKDLMAKEIGMSAYDLSIDKLKEIDSKDNWKIIWR